ncbi:MAG: glycosyltransferase [Hyphomicrobiaceae bacterium]
MNPLLSVLSEGMTPGLLMAGLLLLLLPWIEPHGRWRAVPIWLVLALTAYYLGWRIFATLPPLGRPVDFLFGCLFLLIEFCCVVGATLSYVTLTRFRDRSPEATANAGWLAALPRPPRVDVFICTYNEDRDILQRTIVGATGMTWSNYRVWVLDDGRRPWLQELAAAHGCEYLTRPDNAHAKAGNINHAIRHVSALADPPDFISILDADFVPTPRFLSRTLALFREADVGIVQTPQHFINPDPIQTNLGAADAWPDEQRYFFDVLMAAKDAWGTAFCCGTSSVIRFEAVERAGGFPTESVTEDYLLTLRLKRNGYRTIYLNERLSIGLAPEGLQEYITQRSRWCLGFMQIIRGADGPFKMGNGLAFLDRLSLIESFLYWSMGYLFRVAGILVPILYLVFGICAVDVGTSEGIAHFLPYYIAQVSVMAWLSGLRVLPVMTDISQLLAAREILMAVAAGLFRPRGQKFKVTAKGGDRSQTVVQWRMIRFFGLLLGLTILGVIMAFGGDTSLQDSAAVALFWSWYNTMILIAGIAICIEKPRFRRHDRLLGQLTASVSFAGREHTYLTADISIGGMRLLGATTAPVGTRVTVNLGEACLQGAIVRRSDDDFAIALDQTPDAFAAMVRRVYSGTFEVAANSIRAHKVAGRIVRRLMQ